ncbi:MAG: glycosyl hydrolase family 18 [Lachnospiraceae bacterium]|nr:glycosyl hydrolase family 18 [Lachnospiraceae bacterium]MCI9470506.1 glycosyl hydrolase family 18 [Lachnospiraceae bacterium]
MLYKKKKQNITPVIVVVLLIVLIGVIGLIVHMIQKYTPTKERMDPAAYYEITDMEELPLVFGTEILSVKGRLIDGGAYVPVEAVNGYLNKRFYWDANEQILLYTTPTEKMVIVPEADSYMVGEESRAAGVVICRVVGGALYIHIDFVKQVTDIDYALLTDPGRLVVQYQWSDVSVVEVKEDTQVRYRGGIKSEILTDVAEGAVLRVVDDLDDWKCVVTEDGYIGYIRSSKLDREPQIRNFERQFQAPEYTSISRDYPINLTWHQVTNMDANDSLDEMTAQAAGVNVIAPTWFSLISDQGEISSLASADYVAKAHAKGMEVWGLVSNFEENVSTFETLSHTTSRTRLENLLIQAAQQYGLDGINVDLENLSEDTGPHFIQFLRELSILCRVNQIVLSVDNPVPQEFTKHYDRQEQGVVADYVIVMGYDENYADSPKAGSVASYPWVRQGVEDTVAVVPAGKVINAVPFYTRIWKTTAGILSSEAVGMAEASRFIKRNQIETYWDKESCQNYGEYNNGESFYQVWLEDAESLEVKMGLVKEYGLAGVASWKLGFERKNIWKVIGDGLK